MPLFQTSVLKKYLSQQDRIAVEKAYRKYSKYFLNAEIQENIRSSKEEQFQATFLTELFVNVLDYTINPSPQYNLTTEYKNEKNNRKADGALLKDGTTLAVVELKGTNTKDLESIRRQAFDYKVNHKGCRYVITSNFEKLRFYIDDATDHEPFNLFQLTQDRFTLLYLCLHKDNLLNALPLKIKQDSLVKEEQITKEFYNDYSLFKRELFRDLVKRNAKKIRAARERELKEITTDSAFQQELQSLTKNVKLALFKRSQKLIDRFLFIFFAEDRGLLTPNSTLQILEKWKADMDFGDERPLYNLFKQYFNYLDTGRKGTSSRAEIYAYNGGLFQPDSILDGLEIDDDLLYHHTLKLANYDFESQVDVNILGHIFENSLNEIENVNSEIEGAEFDKQKSKRKKDGIFYTPKYITKYIVENTVGKLCDEKKIELGFKEEEYFKGRKNRKGFFLQKLVDILDEYRDWLLKITICDPACGSGAFLNQALDFLIREHQYIDELKAKVLGGGLQFPDIENTILENNIYGVDLNEESVEIAKLSLWLRTAQPRRKLNDLSSNIKCGNSLIDSKAVAGEKAFHWETAFVKIFAKGGFDVVIGNPPYVFARENFSNAEKTFYSKNYKSADYQVNTYLLFIEKTINLIGENGTYGLIVPNAWLMVYSGIGLRKVILKTSQINEIINLEGYSFEGVNVETIILIAQKSKTGTNYLNVLLNNGKEFYFSHKRKQSDFSENEGKEFRVFSDEKSLSITDKLKSKAEILDNLVSIKAGLQAYEKNKGTPKQTSEDVSTRPYDYDYKFDETTFKYLEGKDVNRYSLQWSGLYLKYGDNLASPRTLDLFEGEKIIVREIAGKYPRCLLATFDDKLHLFNRSNIAIIKKQNSSITLRYVLCLLNSKVLSYWFIKNTAKSVRKMFPKIILKDLRLFPIVIAEKEIQSKFELLAESILLKTKEFNECINYQNSFLLKKYSLENLSRKLEAWQDLDFGDFIKELNKAIKATNKIREKEGQSPVAVLTKTDEFEWLDLFEQNKKKAQDLQVQIDSIEQQIDTMVYELYGLNEEEITLVENA